MFPNSVFSGLGVSLAVLLNYALNLRAEVCFKLALDFLKTDNFSTLFFPC